MEAIFPLINLLQAIFLGVWSAFCITCAFVAGLVTFRRELPLAMARTMWAPPLIAMTGSRLAVEPLPDIDWSKPHIYLMNHQSMADIACAFAGIPANLRFVAKHTLGKVPFIGWYMKFTGMILINRSNRAAAVRSLHKAGERIREGANIIAYPEGTRSADGTILPFKKGPFMLALEAKVPIVPVAIEGSGRMLPRDGFRIRPTLIRMKIGEPIETAHLTPADRDDLMRRTRDIIIRMHREIGGRGGDDVAIAPAGVEGRA
ncbi:MAG: 1-acyl-sn-glycerol-3-phosphate acyltransferase [Myxococcaceae bacterium]|nr:1-acyl-sn-glycerol-3-phosphate acyltransferase [Myxococcaceae bacterium]